MARSYFGGTTNDWLFDPYSFGERDLLSLQAGITTLDFYSAETGGTHYTDLLDQNAVAASHITVTGHQVPRFQGPDGVLGMWVQKQTTSDPEGDDTPREFMEARDIAGLAAAVSSATASASAASASAAAAAASMATKVDKGSLVFNVKDYGAVAGGSGATNLSAFQAALAAAAAGGTVYVPPGNFGITGDLAVSTGSVTLRGAGDGSILTFTNGGLIFDGDGPGYLTEVGLHDLRISRFGTVGPALRFKGGGTGTGVAHFNASNVRVVGSTGECLLIDGSYIGTLVGCYFIGGVTGIKVAFDSIGGVVAGNNISFHGGETQGCGTAASLDSSYGVSFYDHAFEGSTTGGVDVTKDAYGTGFYGCYWEGNATYDLRIGNAVTTTGPVGLVVHGGFFEDGAGAKTNSIIAIRCLGLDIRSNAFFNYGDAPIKILEAAAGAVQGQARDNAHNGSSANSTVAYNAATRFNQTVIGQNDATATVAGTPLTLHKQYTITHDFGSIAAGATAEVSLTATGVLTGDDVVVHTNDLEAGLIPYACSVTAANTIKLRVANVSAAAIDPAARNWRFRVWR